MTPSITFSDILLSNNKLALYIYSAVSLHVYQGCTTYGPQKLFLRPARAFAIVENVAKTRPQLIIVLEFLQHYNEISTSK